MDIINNCPVCKKSAALKERYIHGSANKKAYWVSCELCNFRTQDRNRSQKAIVEWNNYGICGRSMDEQTKFIKTRYGVNLV